MARKSKSETIQIQVKFGGVSIGDKTARIGVSILRELLDVERADAILCEHQLTGRVQVNPRGDDPDQKHLFDGEKHEIIGSFQSKGFSVTGKTIGAGLTFQLNDLGGDLSELGHFAKRDGLMVIDQIGAIEKPDGEDEDEDEDDDAEEGAP